MRAGGGGCAGSEAEAFGDEVEALGDTERDRSRTQQAGVSERRERDPLPAGRDALLDERLAGPLHQAPVRHAGRDTPARIPGTARTSRTRDDLGGERRVVAAAPRASARCGRAATWSRRRSPGTSGTPTDTARTARTCSVRRVDPEIHQSIHQRRSPGSRPGLRRPVGSKFAFIRSWISRTGGRQLAGGLRSFAEREARRRSTRDERPRCRGRRSVSQARPGDSDQRCAGNGGGPSTSSNVGRSREHASVRRRCRRRALRAGPMSSSPSHSTALGRSSASRTANGSASSDRSHDAGGGIGLVRRITSASRPERAERADHQPGQVEAGDVLDRRAAAVDDAALGRHVADLQERRAQRARGRARRCRSRRRRAHRRPCRRARRSAVR